MTVRSAGLETFGWLSEGGGDDPGADDVFSDEQSLLATLILFSLRCHFLLVSDLNSGHFSGF